MVSYRCAGSYICVLYLYDRRQCAFTPSARHRQAGSSRNAVCRPEDGIHALFAAWHIDARNQPPFVIHHFSYAVQKSPFSFRCPPASLHTTRTGIGTVCFANILYGAIAGITRFEVKNVEYRSANIPKGFDGYRVLQLSDIHIGSWLGNPEAIRRLVTLVNEQQADLIVFTGDLVNQQSHELDDFKETLSQLHAPDGVYSILGNHDYGTYYRWHNRKEEAANLEYLIGQQKDMGWKMLNNEHCILYHKGDSIALIGVENDGEPPFSQFADLPKAMQGTEGMFRILLSHNPTHWRREVLPDSDIELTLSGHTHAMQMEIFGHSLSSLIYPEWSGMYYEGKRALYVNVGIGYVGLPFRFGAWPEVTVIKLVSEKE